MKWMLLLLGLSGCAQQSMLGKPIDDLIARNGAADRIVSLSDGSKVYTWVSVIADRESATTCRVSYRVINGIVMSRAHIGC